MTNETRTPDLSTLDLDDETEVETTDLESVRASGFLGFVAAVALFGLAVVFGLSGCGGEAPDDVNKPGGYDKSEIVDAHARAIIPAPWPDKPDQWLGAVFEVVCNMAEYPHIYEDDDRAVAALWASTASRFEDAPDLCEADRFFFECVVFDEGCDANGRSDVCAIRTTDRFSDEELDACYE